MCCSWNRWEGGERKKAGKKTVPQFFHGKKPFMLLFFLPLRSGPFSGPLSLSASAPPPSSVGWKEERPWQKRVADQYYKGGLCCCC